MISTYKHLLKVDVKLNIASVFPTETAINNSNNNLLYFNQINREAKQSSIESRQEIWLQSFLILPIVAKRISVAVEHG